jgi:hypothetical protein
MRSDSWAASKQMTVADIETLTEALFQQGFSKIDEFGLYMTYEREGDAIKLHVGFDGSFAAFDSFDELITEGVGMQDFNAMLVSKNQPSSRATVRRRK